MGEALDNSSSDSNTERMTKLLEKAIEQARALPPEEQDTLAAVLLAPGRPSPVRLLS
jgi:hypothetical protein